MVRFDWTCIWKTSILILVRHILGQLSTRPKPLTMMTCRQGLARDYLARNFSCHIIELKPIEDLERKNLKQTWKDMKVWWKTHIILKSLVLLSILCVYFVVNIGCVLFLWCSRPLVSPKKTCDTRTWKARMKGNICENEQRIKGINATMKGQWKEINANMKRNVCKNEKTFMQKQKWKDKDSAFCSGFWFHIDFVMQLAFTLTIRG